MKICGINNTCPSINIRRIMPNSHFGTREIREIHFLTHTRLTDNIVLARQFTNLYSYNFRCDGFLQHLFDLMSHLIDNGETRKCERVLLTVEQR